MLLQIKLNQLSAENITLKTNLKVVNYELCMVSTELLVYCTHVEPHLRDFTVLKLTVIEPGF